jgi:hypothetical protein
VVQKYDGFKIIFEFISFAAILLALEECYNTIKQLRFVGQIQVVVNRYMLDTHKTESRERITTINYKKLLIS